MNIKIIAVGNNMPSWLNQAYEDYLRRLPKHFSPQLIEIPMQKRSHTATVAKAIREESKAMLAAIPDKSHVIALEIEAKGFTSEAFAKHITDFASNSQELCFLIGGPEGLSQECLEKANSRWSLSDLTFPHPLVRLVLIEQLYRAYSISLGHPYHR